MDSHEIKHSKFWQRRTRLEKYLLCLSILASTIIILLIATLLTALKEHRQQFNATHHAEALISLDRVPNSLDPDDDISCNTNEGRNICLTPGCISTSAKVLESLDETTDPCDNFYEFACGKFLKNTVIPDDKTSIMSFVTVHDKVTDQLRTILNEETFLDEPKSIRIAKDFNKACLNQQIIEERGVQPLIDVIENYGGWPVVKGHDWQENEWEWFNTQNQIVKDGLEDSLLFVFTVSTNQKNSTARVMDIDQPTLGLSREFLLRGLTDPYVKAYFDFMVDTAVILGANKSSAKIELLDSLNFEIQLANISLSEENRRNSTALYNPYTINEMQKMFPYLSWIKYINSVLPSGLTVDENEIVINDVPVYFRDLDLILKSTSKRTISNYFIWRTVKYSSSFLNNELRKRKVEYNTATLGAKVDHPRWKECVTITTTKLPISVGALYVRRYFDEDSKRRAIDLVQSIRDEFVNILHDVTWMDSQTKTAAIQKAKSLTSHIAYPDELSDNTKLDEYYQELEITPDNMFLNALRVKKFETNYNFYKLRKPVNKTDWVTHSMPAMVNAAYAPLENSIQIPAAILQERFFSADRPRYMNYGAIGQIIGHEITHGFDDQGRQFDLDGNLANWWQTDTQKQFLEKAQCIIKQYGNYTDAKTNLSLNGINTQGENIADNGGVKEAYTAYQKWVERNGPEALLPGLNYTQQQLFWISIAQTWCAVTRPEFNTLLITTDVHSPNEFRVTGTISNMRGFANDFNCPEGTTMNPVKKCEIW